MPEARELMYPPRFTKAHRFTKARTTLARRGVRGELGNKGNMIQGKAEGTEVRGAFGQKQVMTYI